MKLLSCAWETQFLAPTGFPLPSGKLLHNYGKSPFLMGKLTINGNFNSYVSLTEGNIYYRKYA